MLVTLTARALAPGATITAAAREEDNAHLLRQSGANTVVTSSSAAGRLLGLGTTSPEVVSALEDLLSSGSGLDVIVHRLEPGEACSLEEADRRFGPVLMAVRDGEELRRGDSGLETIRDGDRLVHVVSHDS